MHTDDHLPLHTERLVLRRFRATDVPILLAYRNDPELARYQGWTLPWSEDEARRFIAAEAAAPLRAPGGGIQIAVALAATDELIGDLYFGAYAGDPHQATIGYTLARPYHGRGYATEAAGGLLGLIFERLGLHRVVATVDTRNLASVALLERLGMRREGHSLQASYDIARQEWTDEYLYATLRDEWLRRGRRAADAAV